MSGVTDDVAASEVNRGREVVAQDPAKRHRGKSKSKDDNATLEGRVTSLEQTLDYGSYKNFRLYVEPSIKIRLGHPKNEVGQSFAEGSVCTIYGVASGACKPRISWLRLGDHNHSSFSTLLCSMEGILEGSAPGVFSSGHPFPIPARQASLGTDSLHLAFTALTFVRRFFWGGSHADTFEEGERRALLKHLCLSYNNSISAIVSEEKG
ncbi:hypothetical protein L2E82_15015 [Cichorium intybus]|uniref:Uncharacterized protein n=1 Tax=Cichorium intybus TaxID=13427 RepID=A0ACB9F2T0_CICIN|nr:hypothetical protein L2E82_15015 [Cichorium intybus]